MLTGKAIPTSTILVDRTPDTLETALLTLLTTTITHKELARFPTCPRLLLDAGLRLLVEQDQVRSS